MAPERAFLEAVTNSLFRVLVWAGPKLWQWITRKRRGLITLPTPEQIRVFGTTVVDIADVRETIRKNQHTIIFLLLLASSLMLLHMGGLPSSTTPSFDSSGSIQAVVSDHSMNLPNGKFIVPVDDLHVIQGTGPQALALPLTGTAQMSVAISDDHVIGAQLVIHRHHGARPRYHDSFRLVMTKAASDSITLDLGDRTGSQHATVILTMKDGRLVATGVSPGHATTMR